MVSHTTTRRRFLAVAGLGGLSLTGVGTASARGHARNFRAHLSGDNEVPTVETDAQGQATFQRTRSGDALDYRLLVANIENVFMAHIHAGPADANGPVVAWLYPEDGGAPEPIEGRFSGVLAESRLTADDLVGPLAGGALDDLLELIRSGDAYVNVHTTQHPAGEVRGQIH